MTVGMVVTALVSLAGAGAFGLAAHTALQAPRRDANRKVISLWFVLAALYLLLAGGRILFGAAGLYGIDEAMFLMVATPAYLGVVPLVYLTSMVLTGRPMLARTLAGISMLLGIWALVDFYRLGIRGPELSFWSTEWRFNSAFAGKMLLYAVLPTAILCSLGIIGAGARTQGKGRRRIISVGVAILVFYAVLTSDGLAVSGGVLIIERSIMAATALVVHRAYRLYGSTDPADGAAS